MLDDNKDLVISNEVQPTSKSTNEQTIYWPELLKRMIFFAKFVEDTIKKEEL